MPFIPLRNQRKAYLGGVEQTGMFLGGAKVWAKPSAAPPVISIDEGATGGYQGSTYRSTVAGQWTADGVAIPEATGTTYIMSLANEGKAIRCGASNVIQMWTPYQFDAAVRLFWFDLRKANLVDGRIDNCADSWGSALVAAAPTAGYRHFSMMLDGKQIGHTPDVRYPGNRKLRVPATTGLSEIIVGYQTYPTFDPVAPYGDMAIIGSAINNTWRRVRSNTNSAAFSTEGSGTFVNEVAASAGVAPTARIGSWRYGSFPGGITIFGRDDDTGDGSLPGYYFQAFGFNRTLTNIERRMFNAYIAWLYGGALAAAALVSTQYRTAAPRVQ